MQEVKKIKSDNSSWLINPLDKINAKKIKKKYITMNKLRSLYFITLLNLKFI